MSNDSIRRRTRKRRPVDERFWGKVNKDGPTIREELGPCWEWTAFRNAKGYGQFSLGGREDGDVLAHRMSFELASGRPAGGDVCHHCDNPACVRPAHLYDGNASTNMIDASKRGRLGHRKLSDENVAAIRSMLAGGALQHVIASEFGVSQSLVAAIKAGHIHR